MMRLAFTSCQYSSWKEISLCLLSTYCYGDAFQVLSSRKIFVFPNIVCKCLSLYYKTISPQSLFSESKLSTSFCFDCIIWPGIFTLTVPIELTFSNWEYHLTTLFYIECNPWLRPLDCTHWSHLFALSIPLDHAHLYWMYLFPTPILQIDTPIFPWNASLHNHSTSRYRKGYQSK